MVKKEDGITLIALVVTIIVLLIVAGVTITGTIKGIDETNTNKLISDLDKVHHAILERENKYKLTKDSSLLVGQIVKTSNIDVTGISETINWKMVDFDGVNNPEREYYKLNSTDLKSLGLSSDSGDDYSYIVNYYTGEVYNETIKKTKTDKLLYISSETNQVSKMGDEIVKDGLLVWYDAINNTGSGHSSSTTTWKDLSGNGNDATIYNIATTPTADSGWNSNYLALDGIDDYASKYMTINGANGTIEVIGKYISGTYLFRSNASGYRTYVKPDVITKGSPAVDIFYKTDNIIKLASRVLKYYTENDVSKTLNYYNMNKSNEKEYQTSNNGTYISIGSFFPSKFDQGVKMQVCAVRVYNRALSEDEIHHNYILDKARYGIEE